MFHMHKVFTQNIYSKTLTKNRKTPKFCNFIKNSKSKFTIKTYFLLQKYPGNVLPRSLGSCMSNIKAMPLIVTEIYPY